MRLEKWTGIFTKHSDKAYTVKLRHHVTPMQFSPYQYPYLARWLWILLGEPDAVEITIRPCEHPGDLENITPK